MNTPTGTEPRDFRNRIATADRVLDDISSSFDGPDPRTSHD